MRRFRAVRALVSVLLLAMNLAGQTRHTATQFLRSIAGLDPRQREHAILSEILAGNIPAFLRNLVPVKLDYRAPSGRSVTATLFVMPEYLSIGSDDDFLRIPMNLHTAAAAASRLSFILPTRRMVDAIYRQAAVHFVPEPMTPGPQMRSTDYYLTHNRKIDAQARDLGVKPGVLVAGDKKDVVLSPRLTRQPQQLAIYGWHRPDGNPIQPLSTVHGACYADYSHGIRLVSETALVDGERRSIYDILADPELSGLVSDEGPMPDLKAFVASESNDTCGQPPQPPSFHLTSPGLTSLTQRNPR